MRYSTSFRNFLSGVDLAFHNAYSFTHRHLFHSKYIYPSFSLLQGKHLPFSPSPLRFNIFRLFVILSLTQLYRYTPKKFLFSTATFKYTYRAPSDELDKNIQQTSHGLLFNHQFVFVGHIL